MVEHSKQGAEGLPESVVAADCKRWAVRNIWTRWQGVALALGAEPDSLADYIRQNPEMHNRPETRSQLYSEILRLDRLAKAHYPPEEYEAGVGALEFVDWLRRNRLPNPSELSELVEQYHIDLEVWKNRALAAEAKLQSAENVVARRSSTAEEDATNAALAARVRDSLLKLVIGMAVDGYGFDPKARRSPIPAQLASELAKLGLSLTDDTIRKYLHEGAELLPGEIE